MRCFSVSCALQSVQAGEEILPIRYLRAAVQQQLTHILSSTQHEDFEHLLQRCAEHTDDRRRFSSSRSLGLDADSEATMLLPHSSARTPEKTFESLVIFLEDTSLATRRTTLRI